MISHVMKDKALHTQKTKEWFLAMPIESRERAFHDFVLSLYQRLGWHAENREGNIVLLENETKEKPFLVIETCANEKPLSMKEVINSLREFQVENKTNMDYAILSIGGFEEDVYALEEYHCRLDDWNYIKQLIDAEAATKPIELLPHNQFTYRKILEEWKKTKKVAVVQATGTGKTYLANKCLSDFNEGKKIILAPSIPILNQFQDGLPKNVDNVIYMTYQKAMFLKEEELDTLDVSFIVLDEFHRVGAEKWGEGIRKIMDRNPHSFVLGLSATPIRYLDNTRDMADELFGNHVVARLTLEEAIAKKILPSPIYVSALYTLDEEVELLMERISKSRNRENEKKNYLSELDIIRKNWDKSMGIPTILKKHAKVRHNKFIVFTENKEHLMEMKGQVLDWFKEAYSDKEINTFEIWSEKGKLENDKTLKNFTKADDEEAIHLLFSINMLNEGLHVDDVNGVVLLRKTISPTIYYQQIGRALQTGKTEKPIIFDFVNNFNNVSVKFLLNNLEIANGEEKIKREKYGLPFEVTEFEVVDETMNVQNLFESIQSRLLQAWDELYELLKGYKREQGHCLVPHDFLFGGKNLGNWVGAQRVLYKENQLSIDKVEKLEQLGFVWDLYQEKWMEGYQLLRNFYEQNGHCRLPSGTVMNGKNIELWAASQRQAYRNEELTEEKIKFLKEIEFSFFPFEDAWMEMFEELFIFKTEKGHCNVPKAYVIGEKRLGAWVEQQRYQRRYGKIAEERIEKLDEISFVWEPHQIKWMEMYALLQGFKKEHGHFLVPADYQVSEFKLGNWVTEQRVSYKKEKLPEERICLLNDIGFIWDHKEALWDEMYQLLINFHKDKGHVMVPSDYEVEDKKIGNWVNSQRAFFKKGKISKERIERLNELEFVWDPHEQKWREMFGLLVQFKEEHGNLDVPYKYVVEGEKLGIWLSGQRRLMNKGELSLERMEKFKKIGII